MSLIIALSAIACAVVLGLIAGVLVARHITPDLRSALSEAEQRTARCEQDKIAVEQDRGRLKLEAERGRDAQLALAALQATMSGKEDQLTKKDAEIADLKGKVEAASAEVTAAVRAGATLQERNTHLAAELEKRAQEIEELQQRLTVEFENIANRVLDKTSTKLAETSQEKLTNLLDPLKQRIADFQEKVERTYTTERDERISLQGEIKRFITANQELGQQTEKLTNALRGEGQKRGRWGELVLERILESSGLHNGRDYVTQGENLGLRTESGGIQRPDAIVYLPENKHIVIDSKVTLLSYERYLESADDDGRAAAHAEFIAAVRRHVEDLGSKRYQDNVKLDAHEFVLMFMPIEGALALAMKDDDGLFQYAWERRVAIVGPTSLLMTLKVVATIWRYQRQGENASEIARRAGAIYDKLRGVVEELNCAGAKLGDAKAAFDGAISRLATGQGNALSQVKKLEAMGVKVKKPLPKIRIGDEEVEIADEDADAPALVMAGTGDS